MKLSIIGAALASTFCFSAIAPAFQFRTIGVTGQPATGLADGLTISGFREPLINESGVVAFDASLAGPGIVYTHPSNAYTIWRHEAGVLSNVARSGEQAAGLPAGVNYNLLNTPRIDGQGRIAFLAGAPGESMDGIFSEGQGALRLVARESDQVPGLTSGVTFDIISLLPLMNDLGHVAFTSFIGGPGVPDFTEALFADRDGPLDLIVKQGDSLPGIGTLRQLNSPVLNDLGVIAFSGRNQGGASGIWTENAGTFSLIAKSGDLAQGMPAGIALNEVGGPRINNASQILFHSTLVGPGITPLDDSALWIHESGNLQLTAREGAPAAGIASGVNYASFIKYYLNGVGEPTFTGMLAGTGVNPENDTAIWSHRDGVLTLVAREGDQAPGAGAGVTFGDFTQLGGSLGFQVNNASQVAFEVTLTGPGVTAANDRSIWVTDLTGALHLVAREGNLFDVNSDPTIEDLRTIRSTELEWYSGGGEDGFGSSFNNSGELAFALEFTDFTAGAFIVSTAIPEPTTIVLIGSVCSGLVIMRRAIVPAR